MKKWIKVLAVAFVGVLVIAGCGKKADNKENKEQKLVIGASNTPHAEILEHIKPALKKEGVDIEIKTFQDYILPNKALDQKEIDANYFQHIPFFNEAVKKNHYKFTNAGSIHLEPLGLYSKSLKKVTDIKNGGKVLVSNSQTDWGRVLGILQEHKLIKLKKGVKVETATFDDIAENPKNLKFSHEADPGVMPTFYENDEAELIAINSNFAVDHKLDPKKDAIALESTSSPYGNIVAVRTEDKDKPAIKKLIKVLKSKETQAWIEKKWHGAVVPVK